MTEFALPYTWIVTKSQPHADSLVIQLRRQGFRALAISCIEHQWRDWPELRRIGAAGAARAVRDQPCRGGAHRRAAGHHWSPRSRRRPRRRSRRAASRCELSAPGGVRELAQAVHDSAAIPDGADVFYPTSDAALRQPEHLAAVATLSQRLRVHTQAVYSTVAPGNLAQELGGAARARFAGAAAARLLLLESVEHREFRGRARLRAGAGTGGADRRIDDALLARNRAARVAARVSARRGDAARMVAALPRARRRRRR